MTQRTAQEIFDTVVAHAIAQGKKALNSELRTCTYLAEDGSKCFAGVLIPEGMLTPDLLLQPWDHRDMAEIREAVGHAVLVRALQWVHDQRPVYVWARDLREVALEFNLDASKVPDTIEEKE